MKNWPRLGRALPRFRAQAEEFARGGTTSGTTKIDARIWIFHRVSARLLRSTIRFGPRNAAVIQNPLIYKGKDFDDNVEAHESTYDTWPAG